MNRPLTKGLALLLSGLLLTGCAASPETKPAMATQPVSQPDTKEYLLQDHMVPVIIKDAEIRVGETRLETLLEHDFDLTIPVIRNDEVKRRDLDPEEILQANTSYGDAFFWIEDAIFVHLTLEAGAEDIPMREALITRLELHLSHDKDILPEDVLIDGVPVTELTMTKALELFPDYREKELSLTQRGQDYKCTLLFSPETQIVYQFALLRTYEPIEEEEEEEYEYEYQDPVERIWPSKEN